MRPCLSIAAVSVLFSSLLLGACTSAPAASPKGVAQNGTLKIHPDLLGQPATASPAAQASGQAEGK